jgi:hypothetical protein
MQAQPPGPGFPIQLPICDDRDLYYRFSPPFGKVDSVSATVFFSSSSIRQWQLPTHPALCRERASVGATRRALDRRCRFRDLAEADGVNAVALALQPHDVADADSALIHDRLKIVLPVVEDVVELLVCR